MDTRPHFDGHDVYLLDEYESFDIRKLVRQCGALDVKHGIGLPRVYYPTSPGRWVGDYKNDAASRFIQEMNAERNDAATHVKRFNLSGTSFIEMQNFYAFTLSTFKDLLNAERRMLLLQKDNQTLNCLAEAEIAELEKGD